MKTSYFCFALVFTLTVLFAACSDSTGAGENIADVRADGGAAAVDAGGAADAGDAAPDDGTTQTDGGGVSPGDAEPTDAGSPLDAGENDAGAAPVEASAAEAGGPEDAGAIDDVPTPDVAGGAEKETDAGQPVQDAGSPADPCQTIKDHAGWELCESTSHSCTGLFTNGEGCTAYCAAAGMICTGAFGGDPGCVKDPTTPEQCDSGHKSDWCECNFPVGQDAGIPDAGQKPASLAILPVGDSNTENVKGYRQRLKDRLTARGIGSDLLGSQTSGQATMTDPQHEGYPGEGINKIQQRVNEGMIEAYPADFLLLLIGSNDMWISLGDRRPIDQAKAEYWVSRLGQLLDDIASRRPSLHVIVAKPATPGNTPAPLAIYRAGIDDLVAAGKAQGKRISSVDFAGAANDGTHYTETGYEVLADRWYAEILRVLGL